MIVIDGRQAQMDISNFANLEQMLNKIMEDEGMESRVVTDVLVNDEAFSEIYPHQAEDISSAEIHSLEVRSASAMEMAVNIVDELNTVVRIMAGGARAVARSFRQADDAEALDMLQDLLDVTRNFLGMLNTLRSEFTLPLATNFIEDTEPLSNLITEMTEVLEVEDWILLADLMEFEFVPVCQEWMGTIGTLQNEIHMLAKG